MADLSLREKILKPLREKEKLGYEFYKLKRNPFPKTASAHSQPQLFVFPKKERELIENSIAESFRNNELGGIVVLGEYGSGKTHTLRYFQKTINEEIVDIKGKSAAAIYVYNPHLSLSEMVSNMMEDFGKQNLIELIMRKYKSIKKEEEKKRKIKEIVNDLDIAELLYDATFKDGEEAEYSWEALMGRSRKGYKRRADIRPEKFMDAFISVLHKIGMYEHIYFLIDEFEEIPGGYYPKTKKREFLNIWRNFIDSHLTGVSILLASNKQPWDEAKRMLPPFVDRFSLTISIFGLSDEETIDFIKQYLKEIGKSTKDSVYPFTNDAIKQINKEEGGVKRFLLQRCHSLIEEGINKQVKSLNIDSLNLVSPKNLNYIEE